MTELTEAERKFLTEYLGECFHDENIAKDRLGYSFAICEKCGANRAAVTFRTFDTPADLHAVFSRMVEKEEWEGFEAEAHQIYIHQVSEFCYREAYAAWLFCLNCPEQIPERCEMVASFYGWKQ